MNDNLPKTSVPAQRALHAVGVYSLQDLTKHTKKEIAGLHGMGPKALDILEKELKRHGLDFSHS